MILLPVPGSKIVNSGVMNSTICRGLHVTITVHSVYFVPLAVEVVKKNSKIKVDLYTTF